jgi:hypothetical protein
VTSTLPAHAGVAILVVALGGNGLWLAHKLFWDRQRRVFWYTAGTIVIGIGCLVLTGVAEGIARWLWPLALDPAEAQKFQRQLACDEPKLKGFMLIMAPVVVILVPVWLLKVRQRRSWEISATLLLALCISMLYASPLAEKLARAVFSEDALKVPSHCTQLGHASP